MIQIKTESARVTLADVALAAGVSISSVSKVLLGGGGKTTKVGAATAARIQKSARRLGYRPNAAARQLKTGRSRVVGAIVHAQALQVYYARFAKIQQELARMGYGFMVGESDGSVTMIERYVEEFRSRNADVIVSASFEVPGANGSIRRLYAGASNVLFLGKPDWGETACVVADAGDGVLQIMDHLVRRGVRRIALDVTDRFYHTVRMRIDGYREGMRRHGLPVDERLLIDCQGRLDDVSETARAAVDLGVEALIAGNDQRALMLIAAWRRMRVLVPRDMLVTGFDNMAFSAYCRPALTTVDQCDDLIAASVVDMIRGFLARNRFPPSRVVRPQLIVRGSA